jgi:predicted component of type VI protein secretion system
MSRSLFCRETGIRILVQAGGTTVVGRRPDCDIVLERPWVGSRSFRLHNREHGFYLEDLGGRNAICVNGFALPRHGTCKLSDGDRIQYGDYCFVVEPLSESGTD